MQLPLQPAQRYPLLFGFRPQQALHGRFEGSFRAGGLWRGLLHRMVSLSQPRISRRRSSRSRRCFEQTVHRLCIGPLVTAQLSPASDSHNAPAPCSPPARSGKRYMAAQQPRPLAAAGARACRPTVTDPFVQRPAPRCGLTNPLSPAVLHPTGTLARALHLTCHSRTCF